MSCINTLAMRYIVWDVLLERVSCALLQWRRWECLVPGAYVSVNIPKEKTECHGLLMQLHNQHCLPLAIRIIRHILHSLKPAFGFHTASETFALTQTCESERSQYCVSCVFESGDHTVWDGSFDREPPRWDSRPPGLIVPLDQWISKLCFRSCH